MKQMTPFKTLRVADVQALLRLALQVHEAALANRPWQRELVLGLCRITGAVTGALALLRDVDARTPWRIVEMTCVDCAPGSDGAGGDGAGGDGAGDGWAQAIRASIEDPARPDPMRAMLASTGQSIITCPRRAVVRERVWQASDNVREIRHPAGLDDCLYSLYRLRSRRQAFAILLYRRRKDDSWFAGRETLLVHLLHSEMPSIYARQRIFPGSSFPADGDLTERERQTLDRLLAGCSEKEAADALGLSPNTVHVYVRALYRRYGVSSRGELMARLLRG